MTTLRRLEISAVLLILLVGVIGALVFFLTFKYLGAVPKKIIPLIRYVQAEKTLDQIWPSVTDLATIGDVNRQIFESLVRYDSESRIEPLLATSWSRADDTRWIFHLRSGVKFHNGHALTPTIARDSLLATINNPALDQYTSTIAGIEAPASTDEVVIDTTVADATRQTGVLVDL